MNVWREIVAKNSAHRRWHCVDQAITDRRSKADRWFLCNKELKRYTLGERFDGPNPPGFVCRICRVRAKEQTQ